MAVAGKVRESVVVQDSLTCHQHIANSSGVTEFSCHCSTASSAGKMVVLTSMGALESPERRGTHIRPNLDTWRQALRYASAVTS